MIEVAYHLNGVLELQTKRFADDRGYFEELFRASELEALGITGFVQDNHSRSEQGVIRGMHYQYDAPMGKLLICLRGAIQLVEVDVRKDSITFGQHVSIDLDDSDGRMVWIPPGFANGFCVLSAEADVIYKCTAYYNPSGEGGLHPLDPELGIQWKTNVPKLSPKDVAAPTFDVYRDQPRF